MAFYRLEDLTGRRFGRLVVAGRADNGPHGHPRWHCACDCGVQTVVFGHALRAGLSNSCGCRRAARTRQVHTRHGLSRSAEYSAWSEAVARCSDATHKAYERYGGRGITVDARWLGPQGFQNFFEDMGQRPSSRHSLDRRDNNLGYSKENCRWATMREQQRNRRSNHRLVVDGVALCLVELSEKYGVPAGTISARLNRGWDADRAVKSPLLR